MLSVTTKDSTKDYKKNYIVLEIANANGSDQFVFYVSVPDVYKSLFEKQIISVFHNAKITEATSDYNIFNEDGISVGSFLESSVNPIYQFKTYENFDHDPLNVILNSFSKINKDGEGAGIQKGEKVKDAIYLPESITGEFGKTIKSIFKKAPKEDEEKKPVDSEAIQKIKQKISSTIVATNIRLIASAQSRIDAERILQTMESNTKTKLKI